jgi:hypothetical protein
MTTSVRQFGQTRLTWVAYTAKVVEGRAARWRRALQEAELAAGVNTGVLLPGIWLRQRYLRAGRAQHGHALRYLPTTCTQVRRQQPQDHPGWVTQTSPSAI